MISGGGPGGGAIGCVVNNGTGIRRPYLEVGGTWIPSLVSYRDTTGITGYNIRSLTALPLVMGYPPHL